MSPGPVHVGALPRVPEHGHTKRGDGGTLDAEIFSGKVPLILSPTKTSGLTVAVATTSLIVGAAPGLWRLSAYVAVTALTVAGTITVTLGWTDAGGATTDATISRAVVGAPDRIKGHIVVDHASGNLTYAVAIGLFVGTYNIRVVPEMIVA